MSNFQTKDSIRNDDELTGSAGLSVKIIKNVIGPIIFF